MYLLDTNRGIKYLLSTKTKEKQFWVNDIFEESEKFGEFQTLFPSFWLNQLNFSSICECLLVQGGQWKTDVFEIDITGKGMVSQGCWHCYLVTRECNFSSHGRVSQLGIIGPYFFENEREEGVTINSERYLGMLQEFLIPHLEENEVGLGKIWFQQDGATAHTARVSIAFLQTIFNGRVISRHGDVPWPLRSPDITPCDFFLWGYVKSKVYVDKPRNIQELKESIRREIIDIPDDMVKKVMGYFRDRLEQCIAEEGLHLNEIIFHT